MRNYITMIENEEPSLDLRNQIEAILHDHLDNASHSGIDHGGIENAAYVLAQGADDREMVEKEIDSISTYDPYEGFELHAIQNATDEVWQLLSAR